MLKKIHTSVRNRLHRSFRPKTVTMCKKCHSFYYRRVWHFEAPVYVRDVSETELEIPFRLTECPACMEMDVTLQERDNDLIAYGLFT